MARVLALSSQVVFGSVGLSALVPALQAVGHEVLAVPTVLLSNHPGLGRPSGGAVDIAALLSGADQNRGLQNIDAVVTGYFASPAQVAQAAAVIAQVKPRAVLVDPVLGDNGALYVPFDVAQAIREHLLPLATITTPNAFELSWLTNLPVNGPGQAIDAARALPCEEVIVTSVPEGALLDTIRVLETEQQMHQSAKYSAVPHGTGDYFAGLYLARRLLQPEDDAFRSAMTALDAVIANSLGRAALKIPAYGSLG